VCREEQNHSTAISRTVGWVTCVTHAYTNANDAPYYTCDVRCFKTNHHERMLGKPFRSWGGPRSALPGKYRQTAGDEEAG